MKSGFIFIKKITSVLLSSQLWMKLTGYIREEGWCMYADYHIVNSPKIRAESTNVRSSWGKQMAQEVTELRYFVNCNSSM